MPSRRWRVVCGRGETMLTLAPTRALISVDLPTLGRPMTAMVPARYFWLMAKPRSFASTSSAAACSAARSELPSASASSGGSSVRQRTLKVRACSSPLVDIRVYSGRLSCLACSHSCNRVLGSFSTLPTGSSSSIGSNQGSTSARHASNPASRWTAATTASRRIGKDRVAAMTAALQFPRPELDQFAEAQASGDGGQGRLPHQAGAGPGQRALVRLRPALVQRFGDDQVDQRVAEEFHSLVVRNPDAAMAQGLAQQIGVLERVAEAVNHRRSCCPAAPSRRTS